MRTLSIAGILRRSTRLVSATPSWARILVACVAVAGASYVAAPRALTIYSDMIDDAHPYFADHLSDMEGSLNIRAALAVLEQIAGRDADGGWRTVQGIDGYSIVSGTDRFFVPVSSRWMPSTGNSRAGAGFHFGPRMSISVGRYGCETTFEAVASYPGLEGMMVTARYENDRSYRMRLPALRTTIPTWARRTCAPTGDGKLVGLVVDPNDRETPVPEDPTWQPY